MFAHHERKESITTMNAVVKRTFLFLLVAAAAAGCKPTYQRSNITESVRTLAQKETGMKVEVSENGRTIGLRFRVPDLAGEISAGNDDLYKKMNSLFTVLVRVALSSDVPPQFIVLDIVDEERPLFHLVFTRYVEDVRRSMAEAISYTDSQDRLLEEIVVGNRRVAFDPYEIDLVRLVMMSADVANKKQIPEFAVEDVRFGDFVARVTENKARRIVRERTIDKGDVALRDVTASFTAPEEPKRTFQILLDLVATTSPRLSAATVGKLMPAVASEVGQLFKSYKLDFSQILVVEKNTGQVFTAPAQ
jgi:hypothetical protein